MRDSSQLYLKWLLNSQGDQVSEQEAIDAFITCTPSRDAQQICESRGWTFHPLLNLDLVYWVGLLQAEEAMRAYIAIQQDKENLTKQTV